MKLILTCITYCLAVWYIYYIVFVVLTCIYKRVATSKQFCSSCIFASEKGESNGTIEGDATSRRYRSTVSSSKRWINEVSRIWRLHFSVNIHILDAASIYEISTEQYYYRLYVHIYPTYPYTILVTKTINENYNAGTKHCHRRYVFRVYRTHDVRIIYLH